MSAYQTILARKNCPYLIKPQGTKIGSPIGRHHHYSQRCRVDLKSRIGNTTAPKVEGVHPLNPREKVEGFAPTHRTVETASLSLNFKTTAIKHYLPMQLIG